MTMRLSQDTMLLTSRPVNIMVTPVSDPPETPPGTGRLSRWLSLTRTAMWRLPAPGELIHRMGESSEHFTLPGAVETGSSCCCPTLMPSPVTEPPSRCSPVTWARVLMTALGPPGPPGQPAHQPPVDTGQVLVLQSSSTQTLF